uniref:G-protein coupled receptors family 1 profile domain-containing protein n=1 Tax=Plectus sambesii TaxID=2011161 RepID=A0A914WYC1_9BILA
MNLTDSALRDGEIPLEHWLIGISLSSTALIVIGLYIPCIMAFLDKDLRSFDAYTFMLHIGVFDLIQAVMHFISGILTIVPYNYPKHSFDWIFGGMVEAAWEGYISLSVVLAINRFVQMAMPKRVDQFFSPRLIKLYILLAYLYMLAWLVVFYSNACNFVFNKNIYLYYFDFSMPGCGLAYDINGNSAYIELAIMAACYTGTVFSMKSMLKEMRQGTAEQRNAHRHEIRTTLQLAFLFLLHLLIMGTWTIAPKYITMTPYHFFAISLLWIILNGSNPFIYLLFNPTIRSKIRALAGKTEIKTTTVLQFRSDI